MKDITDADLMHAKRACNNFEIKDLVKYHDLFLKSDTLLFANVFENFKKNVFKNLLFRFHKISFSSRIIMASNLKKLK